MIVKNIFYSDDFEVRLNKLPKHIQKISERKIEIFKQNPLHPSLRVHMLREKLKGFWSISITNSHRIIFERQENGDILFISIGRHDIYKYL